MRNALPGLRFDELEVYYQPIVNAQTRKITAVEALVRWNSPEWGVVEPAGFLDSLIAHDEIASLDEWVLSRALGDYGDVATAAGRNVRMHINVSAQRATDQSFAASVESMLRETRMDPRFLELELTEQSAVRDVSRVAKSIIRLQDQGIRFSLDDFGIGYSNFSSLHVYHMDTIKIDRSIVTGLCDDAVAMSICTTISQFARNRNYGVIAEGVENEKQEAYLVSCGVNELQGYRYGMPVKKSTMIARVRESQERRLGVGESGTQAVAA